MKILGLEFSPAERSVAVATSAGDAATQILASVKETSREVTGLALIDRALQQAKLAPEDITDFIVGLGPGSYTGIRSAIAIAQGWQLAREVRVIGIGSIRCLAGQAQDLGRRGDVSFIVDAQRGDVYHQVFQLTDDLVKQISELRIIPCDEARTFSNVVGPEARKCLTRATELSPSAEFLVRMAKIAEPCPAEQLEPIYLREAAFVKAPTPRQIA